MKTAPLLSRLLPLILILVLGSPVAASAAPRHPFATSRNRMVDEDVVAAGVKNERVIQAMRDTPRHEFIPPDQRALAYYDMALPIGEGQTISPPFIVAYMTESLDPQPTDKVLEIGTGSGYQAAVLSPVVRDVYTIEIVRPLGERAAKTIKHLNYENIHTRIGDGYKGWPEAAPFDKIIVTCSPENIPQPLIDQLREGGQLVIPLGERYQQRLFRYRKQDGKLVQEALLPVLFVPMTGAAEERRQVLPDLTKPEILNAGFEEFSENPPKASAWHYQRQCRLVVDEEAPEGRNYMLLASPRLGHGCAALQGMHLDGRYIREVEFSAQVKTAAIQAGPVASQSADAAIMLYDHRRDLIGEIALGPWYSDMPWKKISRRFVIPSEAREGIVRIGLFGGAGELSIDDLQLTVLQHTSAAPPKKP